MKVTSSLSALIAVLAAALPADAGSYQFALIDVSSSRRVFASISAWGDVAFSGSGSVGSPMIKILASWHMGPDSKSVWDTRPMNPDFGVDHLNSPTCNPPVPGRTLAGYPE